MIQAASSSRVCGRGLPSLQRHLLAWLVPLYGIVAIVATAMTYSMFGWTVHRFMDNQLYALAESYAASGATAVPTLRALAERDVRKGEMIVQLWDRSGRLLTTSWPQLALPPQPRDGFHDAVAGGEEWRVYTIHLAGRTVQSVQSVDFRDEVVRGQALQSGLPVALLIPVSIVILCFAIRMSLRRLELVAQAAAHQDENNLTHLPLEHTPVEIRPLVASVNRLLARMRCAFDAQRRFVHDAAHELRTPITALSLQLENLQANASTDAAAEQFAQLEAGVARMKRLVEQLLRLARQEAVHGERIEAVDIVDLLREVVAEILPLADRRHIDIGFGACRAIVLSGDRTELRSVFHNLLDNAVRYTPAGGAVEIRASDRFGTQVVEIVDTGPGIPEELLPRVFDRFFRIEGSETEGSGLGLAIARHAAARNRLQIELRNRHDRSGLIACVRIEAGAQPCAAAATSTADEDRVPVLYPG